MSGENKFLNAALVGKAGKALVAAELLRRHIDVAYPAFDGGVDLIAYRAQKMDRVIPIQVKARSGTCYEFQQSWFKVPGLVLIQVWHVVENPEFYIFTSLMEVEEALGPQHRETDSWQVKGAYTVTKPNAEQMSRMARFKGGWKTITSLLNQS